MAAKRSGANICPSWRPARWSAAGLTEPEPDPGSMITRAEKVAGGYKLTGAKCGSPIRRWPHRVWRSSTARSAASLSSAAPRVFHAEDEASFRGALHHRRDRARGRDLPEEESAAERERAAGPFGCLFMARRIPGGAPAPNLLAPRATMCSTASNSAGRSPPTSSSREARRHADRDHARAARGAPPRPHDQTRHRVAAGDFRSGANNCGKALEVARMARDMHSGNGIPRNSM
jgi:glutaryl-CoA dehydrogenase